jgi:hypothetical protein
MGADAPLLMRRYAYGGLALTSTLDLRGLRGRIANSGRTPAGHVVVLDRSACRPPSAVPLFRWPGRYGLSLARAGSGWLFGSTRGGTFHVDDAGLLIAACAPELPGAAPGTDGTEFCDVLVRRVLPRAALLQGRLALHAAALAQPHGRSGVLLTGPSSAGKSTLAAAAALGGWAVLSDDIALLDKAGAQAHVLLQAATGVCLWNDSRLGLALPAQACRPLPGYDGKVFYEPAPTAPPQPESRDGVALTALIQLQRGGPDGRCELQRLTATQAFADLAQQLIRFNPSAGAPDEMRRQSPRLAALAQQVPAWRLHYPSRYDALAEALALVAALP